MFGIRMVRQVMWLHHLNTGHPHCPVFRWLLYSSLKNKDICYSDLFYNIGKNLTRIGSAMCLFFLLRPLAFFRLAARAEPGRSVFSVSWLLFKWYSFNESNGISKSSWILWWLPFFFVFRWWLIWKDVVLKCKFSDCSNWKRHSLLTILKFDNS